jgi:lipoate-protein ligase A
VQDCFCDGAYNVVVDGKKVMGTAQRWTRVKSTESRQIVFAHALLLFEADLNPCINAVNQLYLACGIEKSVKVSAHTNLKALAHARGQTVEQIGIAETLSRLYRDELVDLSE